MPSKKSKNHRKSRKNHSKKKKSPKKSYKLPIFGLNLKNLDRTVANLEREAGNAYKELKKSLPKGWDNNLRHLSPKDVIRFAMKKRKGVEKDVKRLSKILNFLSVPTRNDVNKLYRRVGKLEKRLNQISKRA